MKLKDIKEKQDYIADKFLEMGIIVKKEKPSLRKKNASAIIKRTKREFIVK